MKMEPLRQPPSQLSDFKTILEEFSTQVRDHGRARLAGKTEIERIMAYALEGGKGLRGASVLAVAEAYGLPLKTALDMALAVESIHAYSLIHDDLPCMDDADTRRGRPSVHKAFDEAGALLAGDALLTYAFELLAGLDVPGDVKSTLVLECAKAIGREGMVLGQMMDLGLDAIPDSLEGVLHLSALKTGALLGFSAEASAMAAGAPSKDTASLRRFGQLFGILYQLRDDYLDVRGDAGVLGKPTGADQDKKTSYDHLGEEGIAFSMGQLNGDLQDLLDGLDRDVPFLRLLLEYNAERLA